MSSNIQFERTCEHCKILFTAKTLNTRFCSQKCIVAAWRGRQKDVKLITEFAENIAPEKPPDLENETYLEIEEAARYMRVSKRTLYRLIKSRHIRKKKIGSRTVIQKKDIKHFFKQQ